MGLVIKESFKSAIVNYVGMLVGAINVLWLSATYMTPEQIGTIKFINEVGFLFAMFAAFGSTSIVDRFFPYWKNEELKHQGFFVYILAYSSFGIVLFSLVFFMFKTPFYSYYRKESPTFISYYYYLLPLTIFLVYQTVAEAYIRGHMKIVFPNIVREIFLKVANTIIIIFFAIHIISFNGMVFWFVSSFGIAALVLFIYIKKIERFYLEFPEYNTQKYKEMGTYGIYVILGSVGSMLVSRIDILMLPAIAGAHSTGIYTVALMICLAIEVPKKAVFQITTPILTQALKNDEIGKVKELYQKASINLFVGGIFLFLGIWCNVNEIFDIIPNSELYKEGIYVVLWIAISKLIDMVTSINSEIIYYSKYYRFFMLVTILLAITTILFNRLLIPIYGELGAAISMTISILIFNLVKIVFILIKFKIQPFSVKTLIAAGLGLFVYLFILILPQLSNVFLSLIFKSVVITILFISLSYILKLSEDINYIIDQTKLRFVRKK